MSEAVVKGPYWGALDYISNRMNDVQGFFTPLDAGLLLAADLAQKGENVAGDIAEIGVLHGRSAFLMAHLMRDGEKFNAIDIFDMYWPDTPYNMPDAFIGNALGLGFDLGRFKLIKQDTTKTGPEVVAAVGPRSARIFHVDGDHRLMHILADSKIALEATVEKGLIVFDDVFSYLMPEVTEGIIRTFLGRTDFVPVALTPNKAYFCAPAMKRIYAAYMIQCLPNNIDPEVRRFLDHWTITFTASDEKPVILRYFDQIGPEGCDKLHAHVKSLLPDFPLPP
jgi:hypothetical protein